MFDENCATGWNLFVFCNTLNGMETFNHRDDFLTPASELAGRVKPLADTASQEAWERALRVAAGGWPLEVAPTPPYLGKPGTEQFTVEVVLDGKVLQHKAIHDPFISTTVIISRLDLFLGWIESLFYSRPFKVQVRVCGTHAAERRIMTMNPVQMMIENRQWEAECAQRPCCSTSTSAGDAMSPSKPE